MNDVVRLKTFAAQTNEQTIGLLRQYLDYAERGEIVAIALAAIEPNGASRTQCSESDHFQGILGALEILKHRMIKSALD